MSDKQSSRADLEKELASLREQVARLSRGSREDAAQRVMLETLRDLAPGLAGRRGLHEILTSFLVKLASILGTAHGFISLTDEASGSMNDCAASQRESWFRRGDMVKQIPPL